MPVFDSVSIDNIVRSLRAMRVGSSDPVRIHRVMHAAADLLSETIAELSVARSDLGDAREALGAARIELDEARQRPLTGPGSGTTKFGPKGQEPLVRNGSGPK